MGISDFQKKVIIFLFSTILVGAVLLSKKEYECYRDSSNSILQQETLSNSYTRIKIAINTADYNIIRQIPGVGEKLATEIITYRREYGPFKYYKDLLNIPGIGPKRLERMKKYIVDLKDAEEEKKEEQKNTSSQLISSQSRTTILINLNTCTKEDLQKLSGIGPVISERIIKYRKEYGAFKSVEELLNVTGIGEKKLEKIRDKVFIESSELSKSDSTSLQQETQPPSSLKEKSNTEYITSRFIDTRIPVEQIDTEKRCPYCGKRMWEEGRRKEVYIRCPHCLRLLSPEETNIKSSPYDE